MHRRWSDILNHRGLVFSIFKGRVHFICDEKDVVLATTDEHKGIVTPTLSLLRLEKTVQLIKPALVIIENAADVYAGNESNRTLVTRFVRQLIGGLAQFNEATPALIQHPSVSGLQDGTGRSGTTGWNNAGRWRMNFTRMKASEEDDGVRQLEVMKNNYGPEGEKIRVRWKHGVFVPEGSASTPEQAAREQAADEAYLKALRHLTDQGHDLGPHQATNNAVNAISEHPAAKDLRKLELEAAQQRLLDAKKIHIETVGSKSRQRKYLRPGPPPA
jgi:RecA-family ATPase